MKKRVILIIILTLCFYNITCLTEASSRNQKKVAETALVELGFDDWTVVRVDDISESISMYQVLNVLVSNKTQQGLFKISHKKKIWWGYWKWKLESINIWNR